MIARVARLIALLIVIGAAIDPAWTVTTRGRATVSVVEPEGSRVAERLQSDYLVVRGFDAHASAFVVAGERYPAAPFPESAPIATVTLPSAPGPVRLEEVDAPAAVPAGTTVRITAAVTATASGKHPAATSVTARIGGVVVARAEHAWSADTLRWRASLDVVPIGEPPYVVDVSTNACAKAVLIAQSPRLAVTFFEPRPSWATTFVRRALERDPRFVVDATARLETTAASAIVVGGLERVTDEDVRTLETFVRDRGGAVVLLPDARFAPSSPIARLVHGRIDDRDLLLDRPAALAVEAPLPRLAASEMLTFAGLAPGADVFARTSDTPRPVVWTARIGAGRVLVSGALDAWRFRAAGESSDFDRFWRAAIGAMALATPPDVEVSVSPAVAQPLQTVHVRARVHRPRAGAEMLAVSAALANGDLVRLWPDAAVASFSGTLTAPARAGVSRVEVTATSGAVRAVGSAPFAISSTGGTRAPQAPLALLSASHSGINATPTDLTPLDRWLRATVSAPAVRATRHPMRSPWWMLPLFACLTLDWWITSSRKRRR